MNKRLFFIIAGVIMVAGGAGAFFSSESFGSLPSGERLAQIEKSPNYVGGEFKNQVATVMLPNGHVDSMVKYLFSERQKRRPDRPLPVQKSDLKSLDESRNVVVWLGHSSLFMQLGGKRILIDPVFSANAAPLPMMNRAFEFEGNYPYGPESMPGIDYVIISHDHWDHLDHPTLVALKDRIKTVICPLGVGAHLERWGFSKDKIREGDWYDELNMDSGFTVHVWPARHFSGRLIRGNRTLWAGFVFQAGGLRVFYSGDTGYGPQFAEAGKKFGKIDLAIMEDGQYDVDWAQIHMMPEEAVQGAVELHAKSLLPVHAGRFSISKHAWNDPYKRIAAAAKDKDLNLLTPKVGQIVDIVNPGEVFAPWWEM